MLLLQKGWYKSSLSGNSWSRGLECTANICYHLELQPAYSLSHSSLETHRGVVWDCWVAAVPRSGCVYARQILQPHPVGNTLPWYLCPGDLLIFVPQACFKHCCFPPQSWTETCTDAFCLWPQVSSLEHSANFPRQVAKLFYWLQALAASSNWWVSACRKNPLVCVVWLCMHHLLCFWCSEEVRRNLTLGLKRNWWPCNTCTVRCQPSASWRGETCSWSWLPITVWLIGPVSWQLNWHCDEFTDKFAFF